jgi:hypothetical protein
MRPHDRAGAGVAGASGGCGGERACAPGLRRHARAIRPVQVDRHARRAGHRHARAHTRRRRWRHGGGSPPAGHLGRPARPLPHVARDHGRTGRSRMTHQAEAPPRRAWRPRPHEGAVQSDGCRRRSYSSETALVSPSMTSRRHHARAPSSTRAQGRTRDQGPTRLRRGGRRPSRTHPPPSGCARR